jgi:alpha-amylase/alpha-mannosidase (GH57 family)
MAPTRFVCIHGHFYQPPRENPWLESVETQDSAAPFHDWNERITSECYAPNGASRMLNQQKKITRIVNNYARISHNFGPTLLSWLEENAPRVYRGILEADRIGAQRFGGHGPAMAQVYNHMILPLANRRDKVTQIVWGIADFVYRFKRAPEGMWLAETAVDRETLDILAEHGIQFVVLAPSQCKHLRPIAAADASPQNWQAVNPGTLDTRMAYRVPLDEGRSIAAFFYDGNISQAVAFEGLLSSGDKFAARLMGGFLPNRSGPQLVHIATDGESYGHHHRHGDMALAYALELLEEQGVSLTVYGQYLEIAPPKYEAEVHDNSAWSCFHGVERWRSNCGCSSQIPGWNQNWRTPLRQALDYVCDQVAPLCEQRAAELLLPVKNDLGVSAVNPLWPARDAYIAVILGRVTDRSTAAVNRVLNQFCDQYLSHHFGPESPQQAQSTLLQLMELQRHAMLMYTSCGWFFDDISGIETVQILAYAGRVLQLASSLFGESAAHIEGEFLRILGDAKSNVPAQGDGASLYRTRIRKQMVDLEKVCAHYAIRSLFDETHAAHEPSSVFSYEVTRQVHEFHASGRARLLTGRAHVCSLLTRRQQTLDYAVLHFGDQNLSAAVRPASGRNGDATQASLQFAADARKAFLLGDLPEVVRLMDRALGASTYSLQSLFEDEQRRILDLLLARTLHDVETGLRGLHGQHTSLLRFLEQARLPQPAALRFVSEFVTTQDLYQAMEREPIQRDEVRTLLATVAAEKLSVDKDKLVFLASRRAKQSLLQVQITFRMARAATKARLLSREHGEEASIALERAIAVVETLRLLPVELNLWQAQNLWHQVWQEYRTKATRTGSRLTAEQQAAAKAIEDAWGLRLRYLGTLMDLAVDELFVEEHSTV